MTTDEHDIRMEIADLKLRVTELERAAETGTGGERDDWADRLVAAVQEANQAIAVLAGAPGISEIVVHPTALVELGKRVPLPFLTATGPVRVVARAPSDASTAAPGPAASPPTTFPVLRSERVADVARMVTGVTVTGLPWRVVERWRARAESNHGQTLERLAERGGLSPGELWCAAHDRNLRALRHVPVGEVGAWLGRLAVETLEETPP